MEGSSTNKFDILIFRADDQSVKPFLNSKYNELNPEFSPNGRWMAYTSDESEQAQVYVTPFPGPGPRVPISVEGGWQSFWSRSGKQLFFIKIKKTTQIWLVDILRTELQFQPSRPSPLFEDGVQGLQRAYLQGNPMRAWDISLDEKLFLAIRLEEIGIRPPYDMILFQNWFEELKRLRPTATN